MDGFDLGSDLATLRDSSGRFTPGTSGNPAGKRPGTRNRKTVLAESLRDGEDAAVARVVIDKALAGDGVAARFLLGLLSPKPRGRAITLDLPEDGRAGDVVAAFDATLAAMAAGEITPDEALVVTRVLDGRRRALQAQALERRLAAEAAHPAAAADAATAQEPEVVPLPDGIDDDPQPGRETSGEDTPVDGATAEVSLYSTCISPSPATIRGMVARLPPGERRLVAAIVARNHAAAPAAALPT